MSQYKDVAVGSTVYFWFAANDTTGTAGDGATPLYDVRLAGAASDAAPTASGTPTLLSHANYAAGIHEIAINTTAYSLGEYAVFCTLTISTVNPSGFCGSFVVRAASSTIYDQTTAILADTDDLQTNQGAWATATASDVAGAEVDLTSIHGTALTETAGQLAGGFKKFFDVATPTGTVNSIPDAVAGADGGLFIAGTNAATTITTALTTTFTGDLTGTVAGKTPAEAGDAMTLAADAITSDKIADNAFSNEHFADGALTSTEITSAAGCAVTSIANDAITAASINTDAIGADALAADAITEIWSKAMVDLAQGAPSATASVLTAINWLYEAWRNKTETIAAKITVYKDDGSTELATSTLADNGTTFTKAEFVSGA